MSIIVTASQASKIATELARAGAGWGRITNHSHDDKITLTMSNAGGMIGQIAMEIDDTGMVSNMRGV